MTTLYQLATEAEPGDKIRWQGVKSDVEDPDERTVTRVIQELEKITVEAEGPRGGDASFWVEESGTSKALYGGQDMGAVEWAEIEAKDLFFSR